MSLFLRLLGQGEKNSQLLKVSQQFRKGESDPRVFDVQADAFDVVPGKSFAYWVSEAVRQTFKRLPSFESEGRTVRQGLATTDDFRFVRGWWEIVIGTSISKWFPFAKGGSYSPFYADIYLLVNWASDGEEIKAEICRRYPYLNGNAEFVAKNTDYYFQPGLTWSDRTTSRLSPRIMPIGVVFSVKGSAGFFSGDELCALGLMNSRAFNKLIALLLGAGDAAAKSYQVGTIGLVPYPGSSKRLAEISLRAWSLKRALDTTVETSHAFVLPAALLSRQGKYQRFAIEAELTQIQFEIDEIAFDLYGFSGTDREAAQGFEGDVSEGNYEINVNDEEGDEDIATQVDQTDSLLSWAVGVAFGRFDWRLATGERATPAEPEPFDPLPAKSPGMLPDGTAPFHGHSGILVDDSGHPHDLPRLVEEVLALVKATAPGDMRRWLQRDFFAFHLQRYSKSRRKAPVYWPLSTISGGYTLWIYYPSLTSQTLYTAINDFVEPKLKQVGTDVAGLRNKGTARSRDDEKQFETLQSFELELIELRDTLLKIALTYKPNHDDGVQISAAPLWPLFRHKPWQKVLKDTWAKLEKGDYDWAHLAMNYWPERVRDKCKTDKSLAIAHGLEDLYIKPEAKPKKARGKSKDWGDE